jgi:signal transduction histidine kinase
VSFVKQSDFAGKPSPSGRGLGEGSACVQRLPSPRFLRQIEDLEESTSPGGRGRVLRASYAVLSTALFPLPALAFDTPDLLWPTISMTSALLALTATTLYLGLRVIGLSKRHKQEEHLSKSLDQLLSSAPAGYYLWDVEHNREVFSPVLVRMLHFLSGVETFEQLLGYFDKEERERLQKLMQELQAGKKNFVTRLHAEVRGTPKSFECTGDRINNTEGQLRAVILWFHDITGYEHQQEQVISERLAIQEQMGALNRMLDTLPFPVWRRGKGLDLSYANIAYRRLSSLKQLPHDEGAPLPDLFENAPALAKWAKETGEIQTENHHLVMDGKRALYQFKEVPLSKEDGNIGFGFDITRQEEAEKEIKRHISAQSDLLESTSSAAAIFGADMKLRFYNNTYVKLWDLDEKWLISHPTYGEILEVLREKRKLPEQTDFPKFKKEQLAWFRDLIEPYNDFLHLPDGRTLHLIVIPHALGGILVAYEDMTDRLAIERSYNTLSAVQRATLDNLHEAVAVFGQDGKLALNNPVYARLWSLDQARLNNRPHISEIMESTKHLYHYEASWEAFKQNIIARVLRRTSNTMRLERTDGAVLDIASVPLPDGATLITYVDITDSTLVERSLRERNEALEEADRLKTEFLANVSYELRSPLTSIVGFSEVLNRQYFGELNDRQREYVSGIYQSSHYLMSLINDILDLASIEAGYMSLEVARFDIFEALASVQPLIQERVKEHGITFNLECSPAIGKMLGDEKRIKQLIFKLLSNAIKYTDAGGKVTLGARKGKKGEIVIWVEDNGIGIPTDEQLAVFDKFHKRQGPNPQGRAGAGLGLSVVKSFVEMHGGTIELESKPGVGTRVICYMPRENLELKNITPWKNDGTPIGADDEPGDHVIH